MSYYFYAFSGYRWPTEPARRGGLAGRQHRLRCRAVPLCGLEANQRWAPK